MLLLHCLCRLVLLPVLLRSDMFNGHFVKSGKGISLRRKADNLRCMLFGGKGKKCIKTQNGSKKNANGK